MTLLSDKATRLTARLAPYRAAIESARRGGLTWRDLARLFGEVKPGRLRWAYLHCNRYEAEQVPLPEPQKTQQKTETSRAPTPARDTAPARAEEIESVVNKNLIR